MQIGVTEIKPTLKASTFASRPSTDLSLQKSFHLSNPAKTIQNIFSCPSKKIKTPDTQTNPTKTVKLNKNNSLQTRWTRTPAANSGFASCGVKCPDFIGRALCPAHAGFSAG